MQTVNIHEAKTNLIAKAGKPMVKLIAIDAPEPKQARRLGFGDGTSIIPDDFDTMM